MEGADGGWLRSSAARALILAALCLSLVLGVVFVVVGAGDSPGIGAPASPMTDEEATGQVMDSARQVVDVAALKRVNGTSVFLSCTSLHDPPYQAAVYLNFALPEKNPAAYIREVGNAMLAHGWQKAPAMGEHFGAKLIKDGVTATFHENLDDSRFGTMRLYGECRNTSDHRNDNPAFTDITDQIT
ncbi:hypothetical protein [Mycobacterium sp. 1274761.0]|uniref:hypothetical protein n=1 Tax=Mycobacterium sp. 1274761.0 TaxID=1834077 RepID=UPI0007FE6BEF|nr:hypothetical protein [Mycobacterium sp. 1274761.0]OBK78657.1 hypothetical protein A5651_01630 [Mycobacterium sp. 1274761.0]